MFLFSCMFFSHVNTRHVYQTFLSHSLICQCYYAADIRVRHFNGSRSTTARVRDGANRNRSGNANRGNSDPVPLISNSASYGG